MNFTKLIAHRGLHNDKTPENSMASFVSAINAGYAIELDIRFTADYKIVVFHDRTLNRMCGIDEKVCDFTYEQLDFLRLGGTDEKIPLLSDVLKITDGKVPLLIEIKEDCPSYEMQRRLSKLMRGYKGEWAVQSFNPISILMFRLFSKETPRGILISKFKPYKDIRHILRNICSYPIVWQTLTKPVFISCDLRSISFEQIEQAFKVGCDLFSWTAKGKELIKEALKFSDSVIFEI